MPARGRDAPHTLLRGVRIRTVLDARPDTPRRYLLQTLLLAHSWAAFSSSSPLDVIVVGDAPATVKARLRELGVELVTSPPDPLDRIAKSANKLLALRHPCDAPVLLVDNDVCFLDDVSDLAGRSVCASIASRRRVTDAQWGRIEQVAGLRPLAVEWVPLKERLRAVMAGCAPNPEQWLYLNAGVVWVRRPLEFEAIWSSHIEVIARVFDGHPASTKWVCGSDQAGLATAVGASAGFDLLPFAYNYRPGCFQLGLDEQPKILHLWKLGKDESMVLSKALTKLWDVRMIRRIQRDNGNAVGAQRSRDERERLLDEAISVRDRVLRIGADADLDSFRV